MALVSLQISVRSNFLEELSYMGDVLSFSYKKDASSVLEEIR